MSRLAGTVVSLACVASMDTALLRQVSQAAGRYEAGRDARDPGLQERTNSARTHRHDHPPFGLTDQQPRDFQAESREFL